MEMIPKCYEMRNNGIGSEKRWKNDLSVNTWEELGLLMQMRKN